MLLSGDSHNITLFPGIFLHAHLESAPMDGLFEYIYILEFKGSLFEVNNKETNTNILLGKQTMMTCSSILRMFNIICLKICYLSCFCDISTTVKTH